MRYTRAGGPSRHPHIEVVIRRNDDDELVAQVFTRGGLEEAPADRMSPTMALQLANDLRLRTLAEVLVRCKDEDWNSDDGELVDGFFQRD